MAKKISKRLYYLVYRAWKNFQAGDFSFAIDQHLHRRKHRRTVRHTLAVQRQRPLIHSGYGTRGVQFWVPFSVVATVMMLYPISPLLNQSIIAEPTPTAEAALTDYEFDLDALLANPATDGAPRLPLADQKISDTDYTPQLVIEKIGVNTTIIEGDNAHRALDQGVWRMPIGSTPDQGGNTVLTAHRYKFLPPSNKTFYLLDKLTVGDQITVVWQGKKFTYQVSGSTVVGPKAVEILKNSDQPMLTLFTCTPLFTSTNRLVVTADLIDIN